MQDIPTVDRLARALLQVALRSLRNLHTIRTIPTIHIIRMLRDMILVAMARIMDPTTDLGMALDIAIIARITQDIGVGPEVFLFLVEYRS